MAKSLGSCAPIQQPGVSLVLILGADLVAVIKPCRGSTPHGRAGGTYNQNIQLCTGGLWGGEKKKRKEEDWQQMLVQGQSLKKKQLIFNGLISKGPGNHTRFRGTVWCTGTRVGLTARSPSLWFSAVCHLTPLKNGRVKTEPILPAC